MIGFSWEWQSCQGSHQEQKKVTKLESQIPYHEGRGNKDEVEKIRSQVEAIWEKARESHYGTMQ